MSKKTTDQRGAWVRMFVSLTGEQPRGNSEVMLLVGQLAAIVASTLGLLWALLI